MKLSDGQKTNIQSTLLELIAIIPIKEEQDLDIVIEVLSKLSFNRDYDISEILSPLKGPIDALKSYLSLLFQHYPEAFADLEFFIATVFKERIETLTIIKLEPKEFGEYLRGQARRAEKFKKTFMPRAQAIADMEMLELKRIPEFSEIRQAIQYGYNREGVTTEKLEYLLTNLHVVKALQKNVDILILLQTNKDLQEIIQFAEVVCVNEGSFLYKLNLLNFKIYKSMGYEKCKLYVQVLSNPLILDKLREEKSPFFAVIRSLQQESIYKLANALIQPPVAYFFSIDKINISQRVSVRVENSTSTFFPSYSDNAEISDQNIQKNIDDILALATVMSHPSVKLCVENNLIKQDHIITWGSEKTVEISEFLSEHAADLIENNLMQLYSFDTLEILQRRTSNLRKFRKTFEKLIADEIISQRTLWNFKLDESEESLAEQIQIVEKYSKYFKLGLLEVASLSYNSYKNFQNLVDTYQQADPEILTFLSTHKNFSKDIEVFTDENRKLAIDALSHSEVRNFLICKKSLLLKDIVSIWEDKENKTALLTALANQDMVQYIQDKDFGYLLSQSYIDMLPYILDIGKMMTNINIFPLIGAGILTIAEVSKYRNEESSFLFTFAKEKSLCELRQLVEDPKWDKLGSFGLYPPLIVTSLRIGLAELTNIKNWGRFDYLGFKSWIKAIDQVFAKVISILIDEQNFYHKWSNGNSQTVELQQQWLEKFRVFQRIELAKETDNHDTLHIAKNFV